MFPTTSAVQVQQAFQCCVPTLNEMAYDLDIWQASSPWQYVGQNQRSQSLVIVHRHMKENFLKWLVRPRTRDIIV